VAFVAERLRPRLATYLAEEAVRREALGAPHAATAVNRTAGEQGGDLMAACAALLTSSATTQPEHAKKAAS
jgi:hypothetical protein